MSGIKHFSQIIILEPSQDDMVRTEAILKETFNSFMVRAFFQGKAMVQYLDSPAVRMTGDLPDLILIDIDLPNQDSFETLRAFRNLSHTQNIPLILHTRTWDFEKIEKRFELGAHAIVPKFSAVQLKAQICRILSELQAA